MAKNNPERDAFRQQGDKFNDSDSGDALASERLSREANAAGNDKVSQKAEDFKVTDANDSIEKTLAGLLSRIADKAAGLPADMREQLVAGNRGFIDDRLLAVVENPHQYKLGDQQDPQAVKNFLARVQNAG